MKWLRDVRKLMLLNILSILGDVKLLTFYLLIINKFIFDNFFSY